MNSCDIIYNDEFAGGVFMTEEIRYEYDAKGQALIRCAPGEPMLIIDKSNVVWRELSPEDEPYARAIYLGQGCWERLVTINEETAKYILGRWLVELPYDRNRGDTP